MATFELTDAKGGVYHIDAPDERAAAAALMQATGGGATAQAAPASAPVSTTADVLKSGGVGVGKGFIGLAGLPGDLAEMGARGLDRATQYIGGKFGVDPENLRRPEPAKNLTSLITAPAERPQYADRAPTYGSADITKAVESQTGEFYKPQTTAGKYAETVGEMAPGLIGGGGTIALARRAITNVVLPGVASEAAGQATEGTKAEPYARIAAGLTAGLGAGLAATPLANAVTSRATGMSRSATQHVVDAMMADKPANVQAEMARLGPNATLADAGPAFLGKAQGASLNSDEGRSILQGALKARNEGTNQRIAGDVNAALGPAEDPQTVTNAIRAHRSAVDEVNYPAAFRGAPPVDTANVLVQLGPMIQGSVGMERKALENLRGMLMTERQVPRLDPQTGYHMSDAHGNPLFDTVPTPQTDPQILHKIKGEIDNVIQYDAPGLGIPAAALSRQQGALKHLRGELNSTLEQQVPGYANANTQSSALARRGEAVDLGTQYLGSGKTTASPDRFANEFNQLQPGEQIAFAKGSRGNIDRVLGTKANDLQALKSELQGEGGWNTAKIATVHGQDAADALVGTVDSNAKFRDTYNKVVENSQTAQRTAAANAMKPTPATETALINPNMSLTGLAGTGAKKAVSYVADALLRRDPTKAYGEVADILSKQGASRDAAMQSIIDAVNRRQRNAALAPTGSDRSALVAAVMSAALR